MGAFNQTEGTFCLAAQRALSKNNFCFPRGCIDKIVYTALLGSYNNSWSGHCHHGKSTTHHYRRRGKVSLPPLFIKVIEFIYIHSTFSSLLKTIKLGVFHNLALHSKHPAPPIWRNLQTRRVFALFSLGLPRAPEHFPTLP